LPLIAIAEALSHGQNTSRRPTLVIVSGLILLESIALELVASIVSVAIIPKSITIVSKSIAIVSLVAIAIVTLIVSIIALMIAIVSKPVATVTLVIAIVSISVTIAIVTLMIIVAISPKGSFVHPPIVAICLYCRGEAN